MALKAHNLSPLCCIHSYFYLILKFSQKMVEDI